MPDLEENYPYGSTTKYIDEKISDACKEIANNDGDINTVLQLFPIVMLGQNELQSRYNKKTVGVSLGVALLSLVVAGVALWVAYANDVSSSRWERDQMKVLGEIKENTTCLPVSKESIESIPAKPTPTPTASPSIQPAKGSRRSRGQS